MTKTFIAALAFAAVGASNAFAGSVVDTGFPHAVNSASGAAGGDTFLGFSSGAINSASRPQRWMAVPFFVHGGGAMISDILTDWFKSAGSEGANIHLKIWARTALNAPTGSPLRDDVFPWDGEAGQGELDNREVAFGINFAPNDIRHRYHYSTPFYLAPGDYYFTFTSGPEINPDLNLSNDAFANWFTGGNKQDASLKQDLAWRSASYPTPGFAAYAPTTITNATDTYLAYKCEDDRDRWTPCFTFEGKHLPGSYSIDDGSAFSGNLASLRSSDDNKLKVFSGDDLGCQVTFNGESSLASADVVELKFNFEHSLSRTGIAYSVQLNNYADSTFDEVLAGESPLSDLAETADVTTDAGKYVSSSKAMQATVLWGPFNDEVPSQDGWLHNVDEATWEVFFLNE